MCQQLLLHSQHRHFTTLQILRLLQHVAYKRRLGERDVSTRFINVLDFREKNQTPQQQRRKQRVYV